MSEGTCKPGFERVAEAFAKNFDSKGEVGASVCLTVKGETVVDLWGGVADPKTGTPWTTDTVGIVFSCTKGATALRAKVKDSGPYEWDYMTGLLADEAPFWPPGTRNGYHGFTFGWTVGEMVR